jgi:uncharacterized protein YgbK (DUF1537 family)
MKRVLVIADDLTGAAEIGGIGVQHGLSAKVIRGEFRDADADLLVLDTDTRNQSPQQAAECIRRILSGCQREKFELIYKKTDSILRGPVAAEIVTILDVLRFGRALLAPQNPSLGRVIRDGQYFVKGVPLDHTEFAHDPEHPRTSADVRELIDSADQRIAIASAESVQELGELAMQIDRSLLLAGGADFFAAALEAHGVRHVDAPPLPSIDGKQLFVCGSACASSRAAVEAAQNRAVPAVAMPRQLFHAGVSDHGMIQQWADQVRESFGSTDKAILIVAEPSMPDRAGHVRQVMASTVQRILTQQLVDALWIEGGSTAAAIVDAMNWREFRVDGTIAPGVVSLCALGSQNQRLILKPGSYAWPIGAL